MTPTLKEEFATEACVLIDRFLEKGLNPSNILKDIAIELEESD